MMATRLEELLKFQINTIVKELTAKAQERMSKRDFNLFIQAPDIFYAAAVLNQGKFVNAERKELYVAL